MSTAFIIAGVMVGLPVLVYFCVKFGTAGYLTAKNLFQQRNKPPSDEPE